MRLLINLSVFKRLLAITLFAMLLGCNDMTKQSQTAPAQPPYYRLSGGTTTGPLQVKRVELLFPNNRGDITVPINSKLSVKAIVQFNGNGLFRATWEVDGRVLENVAINVSYGDTLELVAKKTTVLPTFEPGPHRVTLKIEQPKTSFVVPTVNYFVAFQ
jgi:hypothetical protein